MTSCLPFAKSSGCEFVSKVLRRFNNQRSGRFVLAQHSVQPIPGKERRGHAGGRLCVFKQFVRVAWSWFRPSGVLSSYQQVPLQGATQTLTVGQIPA